MSHDQIHANKLHWDDRADFHVGQALNQDTPAGYRINEFLAGKCTLRPCEIESLGDAAGKSLVHLQCHIGLDTISWARRGANATGVDLSGKSIHYARELAQKTGVKADFHECDVYATADVLGRTYDIVYTSRGVLVWLPDLDRWARTVARLMHAGSVFYIHEEHTLMDCFEPVGDAGQEQFVLKYDYFANAIETGENGTYTDRQAKLAHPKNYQWQHRLGDVVTALARAGLVIDEMKEMPEGFYQRHPQMQRQSDGTWTMPKHLAKVPLSFSIRAHK